MNTIKLGKLAKDLKNSLHFIKFFWFAMFTRNDYSNTCQIKIKANSRISFLSCSIDWRYTPWFLWVINIPVSFSFIWNFSPYHLIELIGRKKTFQYDPNISFYPSFSLWVKLLEIFSITSIYYYFRWYWNHQQNNCCNFLGKILILPFKTFLEYLGSSISCNITFN